MAQAHAVDDQGETESLNEVSLTNKLTRHHRPTSDSLQGKFMMGLHRLPGNKESALCLVQQVVKSYFGIISL